MSMDLLKQQRQFFQSGATRPLSFRLDQLQRLKTAIVSAQDDILAAAKADLGRPAYEAYFEIATIAEINQAIKKLPQWLKPKKVATGIDQFPSQAWIQPDPLGVTLIIGPWNYPFQLIMSPWWERSQRGIVRSLNLRNTLPIRQRLSRILLRLPFLPIISLWCKGMRR